MRHSLSEEALGSPRRLGELIAGQAWRASSRFQQLVEEPRFIGQIAAALLTEDRQVASSLIHQATLTKISADLERERLARRWMKGARDSLRRRIRFTSIRGQRGSQSSGGQSAERETLVAPRLEPRLFLRPQGEGKWEAAVELPDLSHLSAVKPALRNVLANSPCKITATSGRPRGRGFLLYGPQTVVLKTWPPEGTPLVEFDDAPTELDQLLRSECVIGAGPKWLFKVAADGLAYELKGKRVRPGRRYVLVVRDTVSLPAAGATTSASVECEGATALDIVIPDAISEDLKEELTSLGLAQAGTLHVWPAGLPPVRWDGEGGS